MEPPPCPCGGGNTAAPDHAMVCNACKGEHTLRHDMVASAWRQCFRRCGCATSSEPAYDGVSARPGAAGLKRGDILAIFPGGRFVVLETVVHHVSLRHERQGPARYHVVHTVAAAVP